LKDKKQHIDKLFGDKLKGLQPKVSAADWNTIASKMRAQTGAFGEQVKNLTPDVSDGDWKAILSKMPLTSTNQKIAWWWLPLFIAIIAGGYPLLNKLDQTIHLKEIQHQTLVINNQSEQNISTSAAIPSNKRSKLETKNTIENKNNTAETTSSPNHKGTNTVSPNTPVRIKNKQVHSKIAEPALINPIDIQIAENPKLELRSKSILSLYKAPKNATGSALTLIGDLASWPKIIEPKKTKPDLLNNLSFSPIVALNRYNSTFKSDDANWQNKRTQAEKAVILPDMGIKVNSSIGKIALNSGLIYSIKGQQINGDVTYQLYDSFPHFNPKGELIDYFRLNYRDTTIKVKLTNTYSYIDIPLNIGYQFKLGEKHSFTPTLGTTLSFFTRAKGQTIAPNLGFHNIADNSLYNYRKLMSSWQLQLNYNYLITDKIQFETGIQYRKNINGIYSSSYDAKEKLMNLGLSFGLSYKF
jgi:hypothetical protein